MPPLHANMAQHHFADHFAGFRHFLIKRIKREKVIASLWADKKRTQETITVMTTHIVGAIWQFGGISHFTHPILRCSR